MLNMDAGCLVASYRKKKAIGKLDSCSSNASFLFDVARVTLPKAACMLRAHRENVTPKTAWLGT